MEIVQDFLHQHGLDALTRAFAIKANRHGDYPNLVQLKYSQLNSPMGEPIVQMCRGVILNEAEDWAVVARPYDKFFNHGEQHAADIDWRTARVYEKEDGSLMTLYWYDGKWNVASSGLPDAAGDVNGGGGTFRELFWRTWDELGYRLPPSGVTDVCFMFELMTRHNRIVVKQDKPRIVLHGVRNVKTSEERKPDFDARAWGWECIRSYPLTDWDSVLAAAKTLDGVASEGYVVCDAEFRRVKVKAPAYVAMAHLVEGMSTRRLLEIVRSNEGSEFLTHFPEWQKEYEEVQRAYGAALAEVEAQWRATQHEPDQKAFALRVKNHPFSGALFSRRSKGTPFRETLAAMPIRNLEERLGMVASA